MIVIAAKVSVRKILACVLAVGTVLTGAAVLLPADAQPAAAASENMRLDVKLRTNEQRVASCATAAGRSSMSRAASARCRSPRNLTRFTKAITRFSSRRGSTSRPTRANARRSTPTRSQTTRAASRALPQICSSGAGNLSRPMYPRRRQTASCTVCASIRPNRRIPPDRPLTKCTTTGNLCNSTKTCSTY